MTNPQRNRLLLSTPKWMYVEKVIEPIRKITTALIRSEKIKIIIQKISWSEV